MGPLSAFVYLSAQVQDDSGNLTDIGWAFFSLGPPATYRWTESSWFAVSSPRSGSTRTQRPWGGRWSIWHTSWV